MFVQSNSISLTNLKSHSAILQKFYWLVSGLDQCVFTYEGCDGKPDTEFTLKVAFPVDARKGQGKYSCVDVPAHECLSTTYRGPMSGIGRAWSAFCSAALDQGIGLQAVGREVYIHWVDVESEENLTELQIPLA